MIGKDIAKGAFLLLDATRDSNSLLVHPLRTEDDPETWIQFNEFWRREDDEMISKQCTASCIGSAFG